MCFASLLYNLKEDNNCNVMMYSYGSGCCATIFDITLNMKNKSYINVLNKKELDNQLNNRIKLDIKTFDD